MGIRDRIIEVAQRRELDYKALADAAGLPRPTVHRYMNGKADLTGGRIDRLLDALGLAVGRNRRTKAEVHPPEPSLFMEPATGVKPLIRYPGSKWRLLPRLIRNLPPHRHFVVPFGGSGAEILRKPPSQLETFNDIDGGVFGLFSVLQDDQCRALLEKKLASTPAQSQRHYEQALHALKDHADPVEKAWAFMVASFQGFCVASPTAQRPVHWRYARQPHSTAKNWLKLPECVEAAARRFDGVQLMNTSWQEVVRKMDSPSTCFLIDPPYHPATLSRRYYAHPMSDRDHEQMLDTLEGVMGFIMLCGYESPLYADKLHRWRRLDFRASASLGVAKRARASRRETVWLNYDERGKRLR